MKTTRMVCPVSCLLAVASGFALATEGPPTTLNPKTYVSPSGAYVLAVDPTDLHGRGPADYRLAQDGKTVWARRLPYTLWEAAVDDSGRVAGYAYTHGWRGFSEAGASAGMGEFIVAVLSAEGKALHEEKHARQWSRLDHCPPNPLANGIILDGANHRFVVRVDNPDLERRLEQWWVFDLQSGRRVGTLEPGQSMPEGKFGEEGIFVFAARAVPGTPLVLTHWWKYASETCGGVFTLVDLNDAQAKPVWIFTLDGDYSVPGNDRAEDAIREMMRNRGAILEVNKSRGFAVYAVRRQQRIAFSVEKSVRGEWRVREAARTPYDPPVAKAQAAHAFPPIKLEEVGVVRLVGPQARKESPIQGIEGFGFDAEGRICVLSLQQSRNPHLLVMTQQGEILQDLAVPAGRLPELADWAGPVCIGGGSFVVTLSDGAEEGKARCFVADLKAVTVTERAGFDSFAITALAGFPDGRFAALIYHRMGSTAGHRLSLFDAEGKPVWQKASYGYTGAPEDLLSPEDIARYGGDSIAVLDVIRHTIQIFDAKGVLLRSIALDDAWGRSANYPTDLVEDSQGGFAVYDFNTNRPLVRTDATGRIQSQFAPKFADGRPVAVRAVRRSPDGRLWATDGDVVLRLAASGTVDRILGEEATSDTLHQVECAFASLDGRVYVADRRTHAVHVFGGDGERQGVCVPDASDLIETTYVEHIAVSAQGEVFVATGLENDAYVRFDKSLKRVGTVQIDLKTVCQDWYFQPTGPRCWIVAYEDVYLIQDLREVVCKISRRADRRWLENPSSLGVAPDGSAAVVATSRSGEVSVNTYGPTGDPRATYVGPSGWYRHGRVAYDGQTAFFLMQNDLYIIGPNNRRAGTFRLPDVVPDSVADWWDGPFPAAGGKQLWFVNREGPTLHKYAIPEFTN
jgi:hypothetical protein